MNGRVIKFEGSVHAEADRLLPWWVNGTLDSDERAQVEQHLTECTACQREAAWLQTLQQEYLGTEAAASDAARAMRRLRRRMGNDGNRGMLPPPSAHAWQRRGRRLVWLVAAQAAMIVMLGGVLIYGQRPAYHTLSAPSSKGSLLVVMFDPRISEAQLRQLVRDNDAHIVGGPTETGAYLLSVPAERATEVRKTLHGAPGVTTIENLDAAGTP